MASTFDVSAFRSKLNGGGARPNQFEVVIRYPTVLGGIAGDVGRFLITTAELPGQTQGVTPVYYRGRLVKLAGDKEFAPFSCSIINDNNFTIRNSLENWMNYIEDRVTKAGEQSPQRYQSIIDIYQLDRNGNTLRQYKLRDAFPVEIGPVQLDFGSNDQISTFGATFQYQTFDIITTPASAALNAVAGTGAVLGN
jgi:hypothetical protein